MRGHSSPVFSGKEWQNHLIFKKKERKQAKKRGKER